MTTTRSASAAGADSGLPAVTGPVTPTVKIDGFAVEKLGTGNDASWLRDIKSLMVLKGVHGVLKTPPETAHEDVAMALLSLSICEHRKPEFLHCATAKDLYEHVEASYKSQNTARCVQLKKELHSLELGAEETIQAYVCRARTLQDMLSKAGWGDADRGRGCPGSTEWTTRGLRRDCQHS